MFHSKKQKKVASKKKTSNISKVKTKLTKGPSVEVPSQETVDRFRHQSQCRLKSAWANIIKRYQDISAEETDVIDLATEEVVVDRGILQKDTVRYVGTLSNLYTSKLTQDDDDDTVWQQDPNLCENEGGGFKQRVSLRKRNNKTSDKTNDIIEVLLEASNESFERSETETYEFTCYDENLRDSDSFEDVTSIEETSETCCEYEIYSEEESLEITDKKLDSGITLSVNTKTPPSQSTGNTESTTQSSSLSNQRRLKVYSFNTFDSEHESESIDSDSEYYDSVNDSDNEKMNAQQEKLDYTQQETLNYYQAESIDCSIPPIALTQEQQRLWLEPTPEDYAEISTWTAGRHSLFDVV